MCVGEEVTGGDATNRLVDVHGCDLSRSPAKHQVHLNVAQHTGDMLYNWFMTVI